MQPLQSNGTQTIVWNMEELSWREVRGMQIVAVFLPPKLGPAPRGTRNPLKPFCITCMPVPPSCILRIFPRVECRHSFAHCTPPCEKQKNRVQSKSITSCQLSPAVGKLNSVLMAADRASWPSKRWRSVLPSAQVR